MNLRNVPAPSPSRVFFPFLSDKGSSITEAQVHERSPSKSASASRVRLINDDRPTVSQARNQYVSFEEHGTTKTRINKLFSVCEKLCELPKGWDSYEAEPPSSLAVETSKSVLELLLNEYGPSPQKISPSVEGGVGIIYTCGRKYVDIECSNSGEIVLGASDGHGNIKVDEFDLDQKQGPDLVETLREWLNP